MCRSLFVAIALRKTVEDAIAVVSLLMSAPFKVPCLLVLLAKPTLGGTGLSKVASALTWLVVGPLYRLAIQFSLATYLVQS